MNIDETPPYDPKAGLSREQWEALLGPGWPQSLVRLKQRERTKMVKTNRTKKQAAPEAPRRLPDAAKYRAIFERAHGMIVRIPHYHETVALLRKEYPKVYHESTDIWLELIQAGVNVVRPERFAELCEEWVDKWIELVALVAPKLKAKASDGRR